MDFLYGPMDQDVFRDINREKMKRLFLELLTKTSQQVDDALQYMKQLWQRHNLQQATGMTFEEFRDYLEEQGLLKESEGVPGTFTPTAKADREIQKAAFEEIFTGLKKDGQGGHTVNRPGIGGEKLPETRAYEFGDPIQDINFTSSIGNALRRTGFDDFSMEEQDLETHERDHLTSCATAILIDISHSMILYGEDRITPAKKVAMALVEYIQQKYPKDTIDVILFGDDAELVEVDKIARVSVGPFHTNTKAGLRMAQQVLMRRKQANKQIFMITDGKPSAIWEDGALYKNPFGLDPKITQQTINEAVALRRKGITITTFMITTDSYLQEFVNDLTIANKGKAYFASLDNLGKFLFADYARNKKKHLK